MTTRSAGRPGPGVVYVCDAARADEMWASISSWRRFTDLPVTIVDLGLPAAMRDRLSRTFGARLVEDPAMAELPAGPLRAYRAKSRIGRHRVADPVVYLDADIIVVHQDFFRDLLAVEHGQVAASPSAWDRDFTWTYREAAETAFRDVSGLQGFRLSWPIPNSGVIAARQRTLLAVSEAWSGMLDRLLERLKPDLHLRPGRTVGDQELLGLALAKLRLSWVRLHGAHNMQVHHERMPWAPAVDHPGGAPMGGHHGERPRDILAVHFSLHLGHPPGIDDTMLPFSTALRWLLDEYARVAHLAFASTPSCHD